MAGTTIQLMTAEDLWRMKPDGMRHELVRGELTTMAPAGGEHGAISMTLAVRLGQFVLDRKLGTVFNADTGFILGRDPDTVRAPDAAFVRSDRLPRGRIPEKFVPMAPDLVVEVISPGDSYEEVDQKVADWLAAGTSVVWLVNPRRKTIAVHRSGGQTTRLAVDDILEAPDLLPGFRLPVADVFSI
jgi:Uma2 family endonuclease